MARNFQYKVELFFQEIILDGPLGEIKYYAVRIEFQEKRSPHVHLFTWFSINQQFKMKLPTLSLLRKQ